MLNIGQQIYKAKAYDWQHCSPMHSIISLKHFVCPTPTTPGRRT